MNTFADEIMKERVNMKNRAIKITINSDESREMIFGSSEFQVTATGTTPAKYVPKP